eukprot:15134067-Alexandrium_andersonii.AAC.1
MCIRDSLRSSLTAGGSRVVLELLGEMPLGRRWFVSRIVRNRLAHACIGNGDLGWTVDFEGGYMGDQ